VLKIPKKFKRYRNIEKLMASLLEMPESQTGDYSIGYDGGELTSKEWVNTIKEQGIWGFIDNKKVIHFWMDKNCPFELLLTFIAHETGHLNGRQYKNQDREEKKAHEFDQVAVYAYGQALEFNKKGVKKMNEKNSLNPSPRYLRVEEIMENAEPCSLFKDVQEEIMKEPDDYWQRYNQTWSILGHQVMGAEVF
jgi:hypothetical protein